MDNDLTRLKLLSKGVMVVMGVMAVAMCALAALMLVCVWFEIVDPGFISGEVPLDPPQVVALFLLVAVVLVLVGVVFLMLMSITLAISREYSPFTKKNVKRFKTIALTYLVLPFVLTALIYFVVDGLGTVDVVSTFATIFIIGLVDAAVFYMLALVFDYGCWLQKESDETL